MAHSTLHCGFTVYLLDAIRHFSQQLGGVLAALEGLVRKMWYKMRFRCILGLKIKYGYFTVELCKQIFISQSSRGSVNLSRPTMTPLVGAFKNMHPIIPQRTDYRGLTATVLLRIKRRNDTSILYLTTRRL